jgi:hypothetical protein
MSEPDIPHTWTAEPGPATSPSIRRSEWTCPIPKEVMSIVLEMLVDDKALATLATLQSTSSTMYTFTTPYLYRELHLTPKTAPYSNGQKTSVFPSGIMFLSES